MALASSGQERTQISHLTAHRETGSIGGRERLGTPTNLWWSQTVIWLKLASPLLKCFHTIHGNSATVKFPYGQCRSSLGLENLFISLYRSA